MKKLEFNKKTNKYCINCVHGKLLEYSEDQICWVIDECMEKNYQGIIWELLEKKNSGKSGSAYIDAVMHRLDVVDDWLKEDAENDKS